MYIFNFEMYLFEKKHYMSFMTFTSKNQYIHLDSKNNKLNSHAPRLGLLMYSYNYDFVHMWESKKCPQ